MEWHDAYEAGIFTEFMEQRAPGHTVADGKIYRKGLLDFRREIAAALDDLGAADDPESEARRQQLEAMDIACRRRHRLRPAPRRAGAREGRRRDRSGAARPSSNSSPRSASGCRRTRRATSTRRCRRTGSTTSASSPSSTAGTPSTPATSTSTWSRSTSGASPTAP